MTGWNNKAFFYFPQNIIIFIMTILAISILMFQQASTDGAGTSAGSTSYALEKSSTFLFFLCERKT
jgi:preprotein translocase subunit SecG